MPAEITVRDLRVLRNRGRVTANVSFNRFGGTPFATGVELDLSRADVKAAVENLEALVRAELTETLEAIATPQEPEPAPVKKAAPRKRAARHV